jgi:Spy/CpxP family protein refolding chaperone
MRIRTVFLAATIAALPVLALAQTAAPVTSPPVAASPSVTPDKPHRGHGDHHKRRAEMHAKYEKLSAADKAKFDDLGKQMKQLHEQRLQILGTGKS